jgi:hypothetical protein
MYDSSVQMETGRQKNNDSDQQEAAVKPVHECQLTET